MTNWSMAFTRHGIRSCPWCSGATSECICEADCGREGCPVTLPPEHPSPAVPKFRPQRCLNCLEADAVTERGGYACCEPCSVQADLPPELRQG